jgi:hypothetical protein
MQFLKALMDLTGMSVSSHIEDILYANIFQFLVALDYILTVTIFS